MGDCVTGQCKHEYADECVVPLREIVHDLRTANAKLKAALAAMQVAGDDLAEIALTGSDTLVEEYVEHWNEARAKAGEGE